MDKTQVDAAHLQLPQADQNIELVGHPTHMVNAIQGGLYLAGTNKKAMDRYL